MRLIVILLTMLASGVSFSQMLQLASESPLPQPVYFHDVVYARYTLTNTSHELLVLTDVKIKLPEPLKVTKSECGNVLQSHQLSLLPAQQCSLTVKLASDLLKGQMSANLQVTAKHDNLATQSNAVAIDYHVMPKQLSIYAISEQQSTVGMPFLLPIKQYIANIAENEQAGYPVKITLKSNKANGLFYDNKTARLIGTPLNAGVYQFTLSAENELYQTEEKSFDVNVSYDHRQRPVLKAPETIPSASLDKNYHFNLNQLHQSGDSKVNYFIDQSMPHPKWLSIKANELTGIAPKDKAGRLESIWVYAHSNRGGQSNKIELKIPVAIDESKKPQIQKGISVSSHAGGQIYFDMRSKINDPSSGDKLKVIIDSTTPEAGNWLKVSNNEPTILEGTVPLDATGQQYAIKLHANNSEGGDSDQETIQLKVEIDPARKPRFKAANPILHELHPGQPYLYDFKYYNDVFPEYKDAPYTITFAEGYEHPSWLKLENNQLIAKKVDEKIASRIKIYVQIHNTPGGDSETIPLNIRVMR